MIPTVGRIVHYRLTATDAAAINRRRADAQMSKIAADQTGAVVHCGNHASEGDALPLLIVRVWGSTEESAVNGQVFLDGNDTIWITSATQGTDPGRWADPRAAKEA